MSYNDAKNLLIGLTVERCDLRDDREVMTLHGTKDGVPAAFELQVEADCCSHTWIESVIEESALIGHTINAVEDLDLPEAFNGNPHTALGEGFYEEEMEFYGFAMTTERGRCVIDYRNSSNGYYGGDIRVVSVPVPA